MKITVARDLKNPKPLNFSVDFDLAKISPLVEPHAGHFHSHQPRTNPAVQGTQRNSHGRIQGLSRFFEK